MADILKLTIYALCVKTYLVWDNSFEWYPIIDKCTGNCKT